MLDCYDRRIANPPLQRYAQCYDVNPTTYSNPAHLQVFRLPCTVRVHMYLRL